MSAHYTVSHHTFYMMIEITPIS